ncbi:hypothetical protein [Nocardia pseudovaccinii]|uniref:hypothetical protein n=1 Tax=Nocardia pseudovaccinii TaxID=189540 RepID=UPI0007A4930C|nr:hypothetical protein [Nocardia pseudovaccinii]
MAAFATYTDVQNTWRTLTTPQTAYCNLLLDAAALWIRNRKPNIADDDPAAKSVSIQVVRDALQRDLFGGTSAGTHTVGNRSDSWTLSRTATLEELARSLVFVDYHYELLGLAPAHGPRGAFGNRYPGPDPITLPGASRFGPCPW